MGKKTKMTIVIFVIALFLGLFPAGKPDHLSDPAKQPLKKLHPMSIESLRNIKYSGGDLNIEKTLSNGTNYKQYVVSYSSEGLKIYGLLTVPLEKKPEKGFPAIVFVHGYIKPDKYSTINSYPTYQALLAKNGFVTFKPDLRGHGNSEGEPASAHFSEKYVIDTINAIMYLKRYKDVGPGRIGYWGHSNGGEIGLRAILVNHDIKAASFWAGVVGSYKDMFETYNHRIRFLRDIRNSGLVLSNGLPSKNPGFWDKLDPYSFLNEINIPVQIQHGKADPNVPVELSIHLKEALEKSGKKVEYFEYEGDDHNISGNVDTAFQRAIDFYRKYL